MRKEAINLIEDEKTKRFIFIYLSRIYFYIFYSRSPFNFEWSSFFINEDPVEIAVKNFKVHLSNKLTSNTIKDETKIFSFRFIT